MYDSTVAIPLPETLYHRLERLSEITHRSLESLVIQTLDKNVPQLPTELPPSVRADLVDLETMSDKKLWQVANSVISMSDHSEYTELLDTQRNGMLTPEDEGRLSELYRQANRHMVRKAYANALLHWRGHALPDLPTDLISE